MSIFKAYDIRGVYGKDLDGDIAYSIARAFVVFLKCGRVAVGHDMRQSAAGLKERVIQGLTEQGADVIDIGLCTTPMMNFANGFLGADGSIMITASHNPAEYNGFKLNRADAVPIGEDSGMKDIQALAERSEFPPASREGTVSKKEILADYQRFVMSHFHARKFKFVADCANAMGAYELKALRGMEPIVLYGELSGDFPNHEANPVKHETLKDLQKRVVEEKAEFGIAFDGDADRCAFVDDEGQIIPNDFTTALIGEDILSEKPGSRVLYDLRSSSVVPDILRAAGGVPVMCRVGHAFIKRQMRQENAVFAGELSGHYYFVENSYTESTALAAVRIMNILAKKNCRLSDLVRRMRIYHHSGEINSTVADKDAVMRKLQSLFSDGKITLLDGIRIDFGDWWFNVRPSNTEPLLRLNLEAGTKDKMEQMRDKLLGIIREKH